MLSRDGLRETLGLLQWPEIFGGSMKAFFVSAFALMISWGSIEKSHASTDVGAADTRKLQRLLQNQALRCTPENSAQRIDRRYRGDHGYFTLSVRNGEVKITNNGWRGYGFSSGEVLDLSFASSRMSLSAGDDGFQTLIFDFARIGATSRLRENCAHAILLSAPQGDYIADNTISLVCCVE